MENAKCPALVDGKQCGFDLVLVNQDVDKETETYECVLGHRKYAVLGESERRQCPAFTDGKKCGLALSLVDRNLEAATEIYECPLGHRDYVRREAQDDDETQL
jgi:hypothetical protein